MGHESLDQIFKKSFIRCFTIHLGEPLLPRR
jgi:hypothetical protein